MCQSVRAVTATIAAAIAAAQMVRFGENHDAVLEIEIAGKNFRNGKALVFLAVKFHHAIAADAGAVLQFGRDTSDEFGGNLHLGAPARAFVRRHLAKLAIVWIAAKRAFRGVWSK